MLTVAIPSKPPTLEEIEEWKKTHTINETAELKAAKLKWFRKLLSGMCKEKIGGENGT
jgi:hypothetical protein